MGREPEIVVFLEMCSIKIIVYNEVLYLIADNENAVHTVNLLMINNNNIFYLKWILKHRINYLILLNKLSKYSIRYSDI